MRDMESLDHVGEDEYNTHQDDHRHDDLLDLYIFQILHSAEDNHRYKEWR